MMLAAASFCVSAVLTLPVVGAVALDRYGRRPLEPGSWGAIVVAGCKVLPGGVPSTALARRVELAARLYHEGRAPILVFTGGVGEHPPAEALVARERAIELGVPGAAIVVETRSTTTLENARFARDVTDAQRILVVTDAYHVLRCERFFGARFREVRGVGARVPMGAALRMGVRELGALLRYGVAGRL